MFSVYFLGICTVVIGLIKVWEPAQEKRREWVKQVQCQQLLAKREKRHRQ
jgi:hypothetical protein